MRTRAAPCVLPLFQTLSGVSSCFNSIHRAQAQTCFHALGHAPARFDVSPRVSDRTHIAPHASIKPHTLPTASSPFRAIPRVTHAFSHTSSRIDELPRVAMLFHPLRPALTCFSGLSQVSSRLSSCSRHSTGFEMFPRPSADSLTFRRASLRSNKLP